MKRFLPFVAVTVLGCSPLLGCASFASAADGLVVAKSPYPPAQTLDRLQRNAEQAGLRIFERIDHTEGAASVGMTLRPTQVLVFGHPKGGTPLMQCAQTIGIDLPLRALAWQDAEGQAWLGYSDPAYIARRHGAADCAAVQNIRVSLRELVESTLTETPGS
ncbi:MAG: DUF302 domain-containing protein [Luteimonas sp.]